MLYRHIVVCPAPTSRGTRSSLQSTVFGHWPGLLPSADWSGHEHLTSDRPTHSHFQRTYPSEPNPACANQNPFLGFQVTEGEKKIQFSSDFHWLKLKGIMVMISTNRRNQVSRIKWQAGKRNRRKVRGHLISCLCSWNPAHISAPPMPWLLQHLLVFQRPMHFLIY